jgi:hypothetical protein
MARSEIKTWLSLDEWSEIIGLNPLHFNSLHSDLFDNNACGSVWFQYSWQNADRVGRDDLAMVIQEAEMEISQECGYNLIPDWTVEERLPYTQPIVPGVYNLYGTNPRGMFKSVELRKGHVICGGMRAKTLIGLRASAVVRSDPNGDTYPELCTVTVATTVTDTNEIHIYYTGHDGDDAWEIRPINVVISAGIATITFKSWQIVDEHTITDMPGAAIDGDDIANYETTVDVYRVYNDPATQVQFLWENSPGINCCSTCTACTLGSAAGCFHLRDPRLGIAVPAPATWDADTESFTTGEWTECREPDQVKFWYYSGYQDKNINRYNVRMAPYWKYAVAYFAASKLERPVCGCSNVNQFIDRWRANAMVNTEQSGVTINITPEQLANRLGATMGAIYAWKQINRSGMRISK